MKVVYWIALVLVTVGALNWGLVGLFNFDLVAYLLGTMTVATKVVYIVVAGAGLYLFLGSFCCCGGGDCCGEGCCDTKKKKKK